MGRRQVLCIQMELGRLLSLHTPCDRYHRILSANDVVRGEGNPLDMPDLARTFVS